MITGNEKTTITMTNEEWIAFQGFIHDCEDAINNAHGNRPDMSKVAVDAFSIFDKAMEEIEDNENDVLEDERQMVEGEGVYSDEEDEED